MIAEAASEAYCFEVLAKAEEILVEAGVDHRFVGGVIANPITLDTRVVIDPIAKRAELYSHEQLSLVRSDGTVRDIDLIGFSIDRERYTQARIRLREEKKTARSEGLPYPPISIEPTHYPSWPERSRLRQCVSTIDVDARKLLYLTFGGISQEIPWQTMEPWKVVFENGLELTTINPFAIPKRYYMRNPAGLKAKDREPIEYRDGVGYSKIGLLERLAESVREQGVAQSIDYLEAYKSWDQFLDKLLNNPDPLTRLKAIGTRVYWDTIGTTFAHGRGIFQPLASLGDRFTG